MFRLHVHTPTSHRTFVVATPRRCEIYEICGFIFEITAGSVLQAFSDFDIIRQCVTVTHMAVKRSVSIRELHEKTGEWVRQAGHSRTPVPVTDRGKVVAVLVAPDSVARKRPKPVLLAEYVNVIAQMSASNDILEALDEVRGERL